MKTPYTTLLSVALCMFLLVPGYTHAETTPTPVRFNNENWLTLPHPKVASFTVHADGSAEGITENGISFAQYNVPTVSGIRVQRFEIQDHYHYIVDGEIAETFEELSVRLATAYLKTLETPA